MIIIYNYQTIIIHDHLLLCMNESFLVQHISHAQLPVSCLNITSAYCVLIKNYLFDALLLGLSPDQMMK